MIQTDCIETETPRDAPCEPRQPSQVYRRAFAYCSKCDSAIYHEAAAHEFGLGYRCVPCIVAMASRPQRLRAHAIRRYQQRFLNQKGGS